MKCPTCSIKMIWDDKYELFECEKHGLFEFEFTEQFTKFKAHDKKVTNSK